MSGKVLVGTLLVFFLAIFVAESWLMRGLPH